MMGSSRIQNSYKNLVFGMASQIILVLLNFILRTVFIRTLGVEYLGISSLFMNIINVLSIAELGIGSAITFSMYKPIKDNDYDRIAALVDYYRKVYYVIAAIITGIGLALLPFMHLIVNIPGGVDNINLIFSLYLANTVLSYLAYYKRSIITTDQKNYIIVSINFLVTFIQVLGQCMVLLLTKNFILFLIIQIVCTLVGNILIEAKANKLYPYLRNKHVLPKEVRSDIASNIKAMFLYKLGGMVMNQTDTILISLLIGTIWVGYYANYAMLIAAAKTFIAIIFTSLFASIGNLNAGDDEEKKYSLFKTLNLATFWIFGFVSVSFFVLFDDFITLWLGEQFLLSKWVTLLIVLNFFIPGMLSHITSFRDTTGLFRKTQYIVMITAVLNIVLSCIFGQVWGMAGILLAAVIARLSTNFWYEPYALCKYYFNKPSSPYFKKQLYYAVLLVGSGALTYLIELSIREVTLFTFIVKLAICLLVPNIIYFIALKRTEEFKYIYDNSIRLFARKIKSMGRV